ncbi:hypothetical protein GGR54DRAFT_453388 [Hypoxylon sp. NC1633]|nr:hypothetical protein GGR54DRAFT_453388 [Hypoxylon sp. NC1633]
MMLILLSLFLPSDLTRCGLMLLFAPLTPSFTSSSPILRHERNLRTSVPFAPFRYRTRPNFNLNLNDLLPYPRRPILAITSF